MTLALAAKYKDGVLCATDSALTSGGTRQTMVDGKWFQTPRLFVMYSGSLWYAQELSHRCVDGAGLRDVMKEMNNENKDDDDHGDDAANLLSVRRSDGCITFWEYTGAGVACGDFGGCGSGASLALPLLELVYTPGRSKAWLEGWFKRIFEIVEKYDTQVYGPVRFTDLSQNWLDVFKEE
jgi:hypothetical protein